MFGEVSIFKSAAMPNFGVMKRVHCDEAGDKKNVKCRPSELPLYKEFPKPSVTQISEEEPTAFEQKTSELRQGVFNSINTISNYYTDAANKVNFEQAKVWTNYLQEEENIAPRTGAIALGGVTGLIFGLRGGLFRKLIYTTAGTLTMASVCYPKEAAEYSQIAVEDSKRYLTIAYNFVYGVKPGDPQKELPTLPTFPTTFSEVWSLTSDLGRSAKNMFLGDKSDEKSVESTKGQK